MGGSGSNSGQNRSNRPDRTIPENKIGDIAREQLFETRATQVIVHALSRSYRDASKVQNRLSQVKTALASIAGKSIDLYFGGSVTDNKPVDGLSDVDLIFVSEGKHSVGNLVASRIEVVDQLEANLHDVRVQSDSFAVSVIFEDIQIELLPIPRGATVESGAEMTLPGWGKTDLFEFAGKLLDVNEALEGKVVPLIKLVKLIVNSFQKDRQLSGFETESLAVEIFNSYGGKKTSKAMLVAFFEQAAELLLTDRGQKLLQVNTSERSLHETSPRVRLVADSLSRVARRMRNADAARNLDEWKRIVDSAE